MSIRSCLNRHTVEVKLICSALENVNIFSFLRERHSLDTVSRRPELLKLEGLGYSQKEIVKYLSA